jgi:hypothetical protein
MLAFRTSRWFVLFGLLTVLALGFDASEAEAGGCHSYGFSYASYAPKCTHYTPTYCAYPSYGNYGACYEYSCNLPAVQYCAKPYCYPVTSYDCFGRLVVVWQTGYNTVPVTYAP